MKNLSLTWKSRLDAMKDRLGEPLSWYPYPFLISFFLVLLFKGDLLSSLNPRLGNPTTTPVLSTPEEKEGAIWVSVTEIDQKIVLTTSDRKIFSWPKDDEYGANIGPFVEYLSNSILNMTLSAGLAKYVEPNKELVVLAVDEKLNFFHMRPILRALSEAKVSRYAFETRMVL